jgi:uncharacterized delta-60 repeat protein
MRFSRLKYFVVGGTLALLLLCTASRAQTPVLDSTFGTNGVTLIDFNTNFADEARTMLIQKDGKILIGGVSMVPDLTYQYSLAMARLNTDGSFDNTFGTGGKVSIHWSFSNDLEDMTIDSSGRILASGSEVVKTDFSEYHPVIYRFHSDGTPDSSFGMNGRKVQDYDTSSNGNAYNVFIGAKGRIYGVGSSSKHSSSVDPGTGFGAFALDTNGALDTSYHHTGIATIPKAIGPVSAQFGFGGKIFMASVTARKNLGDSSAVVFARLNPDGTPDSRLDSEGVVQLPFWVANNEYTNKVILTDPVASHFIFAFNSNRENDSLHRRTTLVRWNNQFGAVDPTFGTGGSVNIEGASTNEVFGCIYDTASKKIYTAGNAISGPNELGLVLRLNQNGSIDTSFGNQGAFVAPRGATSGATHFVKIILTKNNGFYVLGQDDSTRGDDMFIAKYEMPVASVKRSGEISLLNLYPNPASTALTIESTGGENTISISDELGREIATFSLHERTIHYDISHLANGVYYCTAETAAGKETKKFIVSR